MMGEKQTEGRRLKAVLQRPGSQFKFFFFAAGLGQLILSLTFVGYLIFMEHVFSSGVHPRVPEEVLPNFHDIVFWMLIIVIGMTSLVIIVSFIIMSRVTHRVFGPTVPILRMIKNLEEGNYGDTRNLRKSDELKDVMEALNRLSLKLKDKYSTK